MWLIKVYKCWRSTIYNLNLDPVADVVYITCVQRKKIFPKTNEI